MSRKFTGKLTTNELAGAVCYAFASSEYFEGEASPADCKNDPIKFLDKNRFYGAKGLTEAISKDLNKAKWDEENFEWKNGEGMCGCEKICGFHTLPNGLTYLGITAGGDWECPLFYILYYDGEKLRGYLPTDGNFWNTDTKTAYGSEEEFGECEDGEAAAAENKKKRFGVESIDAGDGLGDMDTDKILADIQSRIVPTDGKFVKPKGLADIDTAKIKADKKKRDEEYGQYEKEAEDRRGRMDNVGVIIVGGGARTVDDVVGGNVPAFNPNEKKGNGMNSGATIAERIKDVRADAEAFMKELDELCGMKLGKDATAKALGARDGVLRRIVQKYVMTVNLIQQLEE